MKKIHFVLLLFATLLATNISAQETITNTRYGKTLNIGLGIGYYGFVGHSIPVLHFDYELDVARNFTLAPFLNIYSYTDSYYWGDSNNPYKDYHYRETVIPIGVKATYYFDQLLHARSNWDFYLAGSLGFSIVNSHWDNNYNGDKNYYHNVNPLFLDLHIGSEYHISNHFGLFLDLSTGVSTFGFAIH
jgi:hypothetical protein